jgi:sodium/potassium-transporting ATPase subunit alpha
MAYEEPESDIMERQPRDPYTDKLVSGKLLFTAYGQVGIIETAAGFFSYFVIMGQNGFLASRLFHLRRHDSTIFYSKLRFYEVFVIFREWDSTSTNDLEDSYGQEWTFKQRKSLEYTCSTGYFVAIVVTQVKCFLI